MSLLLCGSLCPSGRQRVRPLHLQLSTCTAAARVPALGSMCACFPAWCARAAQSHTCVPLCLPFTLVFAAIGISGSTQSIFAAEIDDSMAVRSGGGGLEDHGEAIEVRPSWWQCLLCCLRRLVVSAASACYPIGALLGAPSARAGWPC